ncbi:MAG: hypothetical protein MZU84_02315 [Sphingobacterium sp.]|nr:hypothetical protein [Sphingobacterium sp.]
MTVITWGEPDTSGGERAVTVTDPVLAVVVLLASAVMVNVPGVVPPEEDVVSQFASSVTE